jgi:hypothetical protein
VSLFSSSTFARANFSDLTSIQFNDSLRQRGPQRGPLVANITNAASFTCQSPLVFLLFTPHAGLARRYGWIGGASEGHQRDCAYESRAKAHGISIRRLPRAQSEKPCPGFSELLFFVSSCRLPPAIFAIPQRLGQHRCRRCPIESHQSPDKFGVFICVVGAEHPAVHPLKHSAFRRSERCGVARRGARGYQASREMGIFCHSGSVSKSAARPLRVDPHALRAGYPCVNQDSPYYSARSLKAGSCLKFK